MSKPLSDSTYAKKRRSGKMMYGPGKKVPKYPEFRKTAVHPHYYWWGAMRPEFDQ